MFKISDLKILFLLAIALPHILWAKQELWVYTSMYKEYIAALKKDFEQKNPDIEIQVFQAGSEKIQVKIEAELIAQKTQADILMLSDPFWPIALEKRNLLESIDGKSIFNNYYSSMVMIRHNTIDAKDAPKSFADLTQTKFKNQVCMGSPLESGTSFASLAHLISKYSWQFFKNLRANELLFQGGNSAVIQKVETGERKFGIVLLENALAAKKRSSPIEIIYPSDGAVIIPSVNVILKSSPNKVAAKKFSDYLLTKDAQNIMLSGYMYSVLPGFPSPQGALPWSELTQASELWSQDFLNSTQLQARDIKRKFSLMFMD